MSAITQAAAVTELSWQLWQSFAPHADSSQFLASTSVSHFFKHFFSWIFTRNTWDVDDEADETEADGRLWLPGAQQRGKKGGERLLFFHIWTARQKLIELQVHRRRRRRRRWQHLIKPRSQVEDDAHKPQQCVEKLKTETIRVERRRTAKQTKQTDDDDDDDNTDANDSFDMQISHANRVEDTRLPVSLSLLIIEPKSVACTERNLAVVKRYLSQRS